MQSFVDFRFQIFIICTICTLYFLLLLSYNINKENIEVEIPKFEFYDFYKWMYGWRVHAASRHTFLCENREFWIFIFRRVWFGSPRNFAYDFAKYDMANLFIHSNLEWKFAKYSVINNLEFQAFTIVDYNAGFLVIICDSVVF